MLRFVIDVLLLRNLIESRTARVFALVFFLGLLCAGFIYAYAVFGVVAERSESPHVHAHSTR